jgi:ATP/maltotriose-dependent transcriptional regulator MalT
LRTAEEAIPLFEAERAHPELARTWRLIGLVHGISARYGRSTDAVSRSMEHARLAKDDRLIARNAVGLASSALLGPMPVPQAIELCEQMVVNGLIDRQAESKILCTLAQLRAMNGDFDQARSLYRRGRAMLRELGQGLNAAANGIDVLQVELLAGDLASAEREVMPDLAFLERAGETFYLSTMAALISRVVRDQGRDEDALAFSRRAEEATAADDVESLALWRSIRAPILARAGRMEEAESLARSAVELSQGATRPRCRRIPCPNWLPCSCRRVGATRPASHRCGDLDLSGQGRRRLAARARPMPGRASASPESRAGCDLLGVLPVVLRPDLELPVADPVGRRGRLLLNSIRAGRFSQGIPGLGRCRRSYRCREAPRTIDDPRAGVVGLL